MCHCAYLQDTNVTDVLAALAELIPKQVWGLPFHAEIFRRRSCFAPVLPGAILVSLTRACAGFRLRLQRLRCGGQRPNGCAVPKPVPRSWRCQMKVMPGRNSSAQGRASNASRCRNHDGYLHHHRLGDRPRNGSRHLLQLQLNLQTLGQAGMLMSHVTCMCRFERSTVEEARLFEISCEGLCACQLDGVSAWLVLREMACELKRLESCWQVLL